MPVAQSDLSGWLAELGVRAFDGGAGFTYDGEMAVAVDLADDGRTLLLTADLGALDRTAPSDLCRRLLRLGHLGLETAGAALSLADDDETLTLWRTVALDAVAVDDLTGILSTFLDTAAALRQTAFDPDGATDTAAPAALMRV